MLLVLCEYFQEILQLSTDLCSLYTALYAINNANGICTYMQTAKDQKDKWSYNDSENVGQKEMRSRICAFQTITKKKKDAERDKRSETLNECTNCRDYPC